MKKWEYKFTYFGTGEAGKIVKVANEWNEKGWRLLSVCLSANNGRDYLTAFFEREIPEPSNSVISPAENVVSKALIKPPRQLAKERCDVDDGFRLESGRIIS